MAKSLRSKREKRLRAIRREIVEPFYQKKDDAKLAAQEAALTAPKMPVLGPTPASTSSTGMQVEEQVAAPNSTTANFNLMEVEMADNDQSKAKASLKPAGGIGKKSKKKLKLSKKKRHGKGKIRGKRNL
ncbi:uncharacterized protein LOC110428670 [Herrania umbratica]|uniref:Uncharacterized protein LOC110428670 n=1 Tax=Herrania umbratica TaxID=108875 RepID=A0A6J1BL03_9ROSI|nr:uncharacterized protein LOC110428670 [Herrania umbratica]